MKNSQRISNKKMIGNSPAMQKIDYLTQRVAESDVDCLILGETGTGKELAARAIHAKSSRKKFPFVAVNCSALTEALLESELFGHVKGAFTGAVHNKIGRFELANNGTLFLDEIGDLSSPMQVKLLRVLQERQIERVGDSHPQDINVRVIAATNRDLLQMVNQGTIRQDFYYRINVFGFTLPPLRERKQDIPLLVEYFLQRYHPQQPLPELSPEVTEIFDKHCWPGNIRELENVIRHALVLCKKGVITAQHLPERMFKVSAPNKYCAPNSQTKEALLAALEKTKGNRTEAAHLLGVSRVTVWNRMKKYGLLSQSFEAAPPGNIIQMFPKSTAKAK